MSNSVTSRADDVTVGTTVLPVVPVKTSWTSHVAIFGAVGHAMSDSVTSWTKLEQRVVPIVDPDVANVLLLHAHWSGQAGSVGQFDVVLGGEEVEAVSPTSACRWRHHPEVNAAATA